MSRIISSICAALLLLLAGAAAAGERVAVNASYAPGATPHDALFQHVGSKPCCYNNGEFFQSTPKTCNRYGGRVVPFDYCQRAYYGGGPDSGPGYGYGDKPCCYNDRQFFRASPKTCRRFGGRLVAYDYCQRHFDRSWDDGYRGDGWYGQGAGRDKPCCYNNGQYFHTSPSTCRRYGGYTVDYDYCTRRRSW